MTDLSVTPDRPLNRATLPAMLDDRTATGSDRPLLVVGERSFTAPQVRDRVARAAAALRAEDVQPGDRVLLLAGNRLELLELILGCAWAGAVAVPVNTAWKGQQLHHALANSGARLLAGESELAARLSDLPDVAELENIWIMDSDPPAGLPVPASRMPDYVNTARAEPPYAARPGETAVILYTSGTTGVSKGVLCPHAQFYWWGFNVSRQLEITPEDVLYTCLPLFHTNALNAFSQALVSGATYVLGERFSASRYWGEVAARGATVGYLLGAMVSILAGRPPSENDRAHRLRAALSPATPASLLAEFRSRFGVTLLDGWGSTETNAVFANSPAEQRPGYCGRLQPGFEARVVDELGAEVPPSVPGELLIRSTQPYAFATGYHRMPDKTVEAWADLWFHTGDRVVLEEDGWMRFVDRIKDVIRRRGENISSAEVEDVLRQHPQVRDAAVWAVDSELGEDDVMAGLIFETGVTPAYPEIVRFCESRLAYFAIPRYFVSLDEFPVTENGKVRKAALRSLGAAAAEWDLEAAGYRLQR
ncbi:ATP-dependent acyl-CoA ligase [Amycolatopsis sp. NPDC006131]|uniref:ATP-dependent acyl-CoA ligase n=1 Tax=Amycolatopsis sp. NPDC006131 TaxID=3156731 RepID=UPI0033AD9016